MDVTIPPQNLKRFTASIACLAKIGKDVYISFDPLDGLTLSGLNEAKSAYGRFHFACGFFQHCSAGVIRGSRDLEHNHHENDDDLNSCYVCRVPVRSIHSVLRPRKGVRSLRIRSDGTYENPPPEEPCPPRRRRKLSSPPASSNMLLSFEFQIEARPNSTFQALHRIHVTDATSPTLSSRHKASRSELIAPPKLWLRLLDPLKHTAEAALTVDDALRVVTATSFHAESDNAVVGRRNVLRTETSMGADEFDEYDFRNNRTEVGEEDGAPADGNERVVLVFGSREAKAMLQFCCQTNSVHHQDGEALAIVSFHWGGRPIVIETDGDFFSAELVLATLHHGMIASGGDVRVDEGGGE